MSDITYMTPEQFAKLREELDEDQVRVIQPDDEIEAMLDWLGGHD